jgi:hypothetical protein
MQALFSDDSDSDMELQSKPVECKPELVILSLQKFYNSRNDMDKIMPYLLGTAPISLRLIDWFVTNYCRKNFIGYKLNGQEFLVYVSYKSQLKAYSKKNFDPFCRRERISFIDHDNNELITTVGQLNFFRWSIENKILDFVNDNYDIIEKDMNMSLKNLYKKKDGDNTRRKRTELSISATKTVNKHNVSIVVQFD